MINILHCSCGTRTSLSAYCPTCGKKHALAKPVLVALVLIAVFSAGAWLAKGRKSEPHQALEVAKSHRLARARDPEKDMDRVDALLKTPGKSLEPTLEAIALLDGLLDEYPDFGYGLRLKANLLRNLHQDATAVSSYETFLKQHPNDQRTRLALAEVLLRGEHPQRGIALLEEVVQQTPNYAEAHERLAKAYSIQGNSERAKTHQEAHQVLVSGNKGQKPPFVYLPRLPK